MKPVWPAQAGISASGADKVVVALPEERLDTDFRKKYPPDKFGEEFEPNARVWKVYRDEALEYDNAQLDEWNKTLDILLIFVCPGQL